MLESLSDKGAGLKTAKRDSGRVIFLWGFQNVSEHLFLCNTSGGCFCAVLPTLPHISSETFPPFPIINVVCKYLRQFLGTSLGVSYSANIQLHGVGGRGLIYFCKVDHPRIFKNFSRNCVVSIIYVIIVLKTNFFLMFFSTD